MIEPTKPLKGASFAKKYPNDAQIAAIVRKGVAGTGMPSTGKDMLPDKDLCDVIAYIRSFTSIEKPASKPPSTVRAVPPASQTTKKKPAAK